MPERQSPSDLAYPGGKLRLFVAGDLGPGLPVAFDEGQAHYLRHVMRARSGDRVRLFNGRDGEWSAALDLSARRAVAASCEARIRAQEPAPDLHLLFAPIKKTPSDYLAQKATELGVSRLQPVLTRRTIVDRVNVERMRANAIEAAEQSARLDVPDCGEPLSLPKALDRLDARPLIFCDESREGETPPPLLTALAGVRSGPLAVLIGPEGGFDPAERDAIRARPSAIPVSLGRRILRADTAALAALAAVSLSWEAR